MRPTTLLRRWHVGLQGPGVLGQGSERVEAEGGGEQDKLADVEAFFFPVGGDLAEFGWFGQRQLLPKFQRDA